MNFDFRSDTVTRPTDSMRRAMYQAEVGDDVYGDDKTVNRLQDIMAERFNMEAGLFAASGTQANLIALMAHCARGDEYIVGQQAHTYKYEGGGAAVLGSIQPQPLDFCADGTIDLDDAKSAIKPVNEHFANTRLFCLENTQAGKALPMDYLDKAAQFAKTENLAYHLDGARVYNAAIFHGVDVAEITAPFDSSTCCFSKGLGAPLGSVLCGTREVIRDAHRWRKLLGGGMRQAGVVAAAAIYAIEHHVERLADDHDNAKWISEQLSQLEELQVQYDSTQTNMVFVSMPDDDPHQLAAFLKEQGIIVTPGSPIRIVTHLDVDRDAATRLVEQVKAYFVAAKSGLALADRISDNTQNFEHHGRSYQGSVA